MGIRDRDAGVMAWVGLVQAHSGLVDALSHDLQMRHGLPLTWLEVLIKLSDSQEGKMRMQDLAKEAWLSKSGITRLVDRMEEADLVGRAACATDRRVTYATITDKGRRTLEATIPDHIASIDRLFSAHLTTAEIAALRQTMQKVLRGLGLEPEENCATELIEEEASA